MPAHQHAGAAGLLRWPETRQGKEGHESSRRYPDAPTQVDHDPFVPRAANLLVGPGQKLVAIPAEKH